MSNAGRLISLTLAAEKTARGRVDEPARRGGYPPEQRRDDARKIRSIFQRYKERPPGTANREKFIKFLLIGGLGTVLNSFALYVLHQLIRLPLVAASLLAVELTIVNNFLWNDRWTFGHSKPSLRRFFQFNLVSCGGLAITTGTLWVLVTHLATPYLLANLVGIGLATCWNFGINLLWTWGSV